MQDLSDVQCVVLLHIERYIYDNHYAPSMKELVDDLDVCSSTSHAVYIVNALVQKGYLRKIPKVHRGISVV